mmetsp:Transcript_24426/g.56272  ORF Transcript_24426/g.56272 Transcript_24426/m.56272 type:complete len:334 (+) Transcript_24426:93-1094(+)
MLAVSHRRRRGSVWRNSFNVGLLLFTHSRWGAEALAVYSQDVATPYNQVVLEVQVGTPIFLNFSCQTAGLSDVSLALGSDGSNLQFFVSRDRRQAVPDASDPSWSREDRARNNLLKVQGVLPWGGTLGVNVLNPAAHATPAHVVVEQSCSYIAAIDPLFWGEVYTGRVCPADMPVSETEPPKVCSGHGRCTAGGVCVCERDFNGPSCSPLSQDRPSTHGEKGTQAHKVASKGAGLLGLLALFIATAFTCVVCYKTCKKRYVRDGDPYGDEAEDDSLAFFGFHQYQGFANATGTDDGLTPLSRSNSFLHFAAGYMDYRAEDRYLRRGGFADDGI